MLLHITGVVVWVGAALFVAVVCVTTIKPTGSDEAALAIGAALPRAFAAVGAALVRVDS